MRSLLLGAFALAILAQDQPVTVPERSKFERTSSLEEVRIFMESLRRRFPPLKSYQPKGAPQFTEAGHPLRAWRLPATTSNPLRVYINANIHAGEVEGKEAVQVLLRELLQGKHPELRKHIELVVTPCYNADGTDALDPALRKHQPNPASGVGRRENARGLDLNRDLMKAQTPNTRWFLAMLRDFDPQVVFDLHTTNGSYHGFHLTYAPAMALGADTRLLGFNRNLLTAVRERLAKEGMPTYDYGNFEPEERGGKSWAPDKADTLPERWETFDFRPRYLSNYPALQNRLGILVETYVYRSYRDRIEDTRRFVMASLEQLVKEKREVERTVREASTHGLESELPLNAELKEVERFSFDVIDPIKNPDGQLIGEKARRKAELPSFVAWRGKETSALPDGYLIDAAYAFKVRPVLEAHGIQVLPGSSRPKNKTLLHFVESQRKLAPQPFQGIFTLNLQGAWSKGAISRPMQAKWNDKDLDRALFVPLNQRYGRLAFYLLDPRSPDGLVQWGFFHESLLRNEGPSSEAPRFPILALGGTKEEATPAKSAEGATFKRAE
jgi:Zinc carboxypeptidase